MSNNLGYFSSEDEEDADDEREAEQDEQDVDVDTEEEDGESQEQIGVTRDDGAFNGGDADVRMDSPATSPAPSPVPTPAPSPPASTSPLPPDLVRGPAVTAKCEDLAVDMNSL